MNARASKGEEKTGRASPALSLKQEGSEGHGDNSSSPGPWELELLQETKEIPRCRQALPPAWASCSNRQSQDMQGNGDMWSGTAEEMQSLGSSPVLSFTSWKQSRIQSDHSREQETGGIQI